MQSETPSNPNRERRLDEIVTAYLKAVEAGENPEPKAWLERFPDFAVELSAFFAGQKQVVALAGTETIGLEESKSDDVLGTVRYIGDYELLEVIARGGMGIVYKARQVSLKRLVAIKMILAGEFAGPQEVARFRTEGEAVARLQHPHIVQIYEIGDHEGHPYFSLEYCSGGSLAGRLHGTPLPAQQAAQMVETLARAMHAAHQAGVVHRDLKPANVLLTADDTLKITDFGLAKKLDDASGQTISGTIMGTPSYMAPEQAAGKVKDVGPVADVYALGAILYELLTGRPPFRAASRMETLLQVVSDEPVSPSQLQPRTPKDLETICLKCLRKEPSKRYASAQTLSEDLRRFQAREPIQARPVGQMERGWRWCQRNPWIAGLAVAVALALIGGTVVSSYFAFDAADQARIADRRADDAKEKEIEARAERKRSDRRAYLASIRLGHRIVQDGQLTRARKLLEDLVPAGRKDEDNLRHFEWRHLWGLCNNSPIQGDLLSPDGKLLIRIQSTPQLLVLDASSGKKVATLATVSPNLQVPFIAFSADGKRFTSAGEPGDRDAWNRLDLVQIVWELSSGKALFRKTFKALNASDRLQTSALGPRGDRLAVALPTGVELFDVDSGMSLGMLPQSDLADRPSAGWNVLAFHPAASVLAGVSSGRSGSELVLWDFAAKKLLRRLPVEPGHIKSIAFSADGKRILVGVDRNLELWSTEGAGLLSTFGPTPDVISQVAMNADGSLVAAGTIATGRVAEVRVWHTDTGWEMATYSTSTRHLIQLGWDPTNGRLYFAGSGVRAAALNPLLPALATAARKDWCRIAAVAFHPIRGNLAVALGNSCPTFTEDGHAIPPWFNEGLKTNRLEQPRVSAVQIWDPDTVRRTAILGSKGDYRALVYSADGKRLAAASDNSLQMFETDTNHELFATPPVENARVAMLQFSPAGQHLLVCGGLDPSGKKLEVLDANTGNKLASLETSEFAARACFLPDGQRVAAVLTSKGFGGGGVLLVWDWRADKVLWEKKIKSDTTALACSPDGRWLVSGGDNNVIQFWETDTGKPGHHWDAHSNSVLALTFSPDGRRLFSAGADNSMRIWDTTGGQELLNLPVDGRPEFLHSLILSSDGLRLVSLNFDDLRLWEAKEFVVR